MKVLEQKQFSDLLLNSINLIVIVSDSRGEIQYVSQASESIIGYLQEELLGNLWWEKTYSSGEEISLAKNNIINILTADGEIDEDPYYTKLRCKDGSLKWMQWRDSLLLDQAFVSVGIDITDSKKMENLRIQGDMILDCITSIILVGNQSGNIIYASPSVEKMLGYKPEHVMGDKWWGVTYENEKDGHQVRDAILDSVFHNEKVFIDISKQKIKTLGGNYKWIKWEVSKGIDDTYISIGTDITHDILTEIELMKTKESAVESLKIKNQFLANMSHEIRTPLNAVIGFTDLLLETELTSEQREHLDTMRNSGEILLSLINNVLDLSKLESDKYLTEEISFDLSERVNGIVKLMKLKANEKNIGLNLEVQSTIPKRILGDPTRLEQILLNLIGNAIKFTDDGTVTVIMKMVRELSNSCTICFEVRDTGVGIMSNKISTIFGAFNQAKNDTSRIFGGTGLGLTIVKKLVTLLKGTIEVDSVFGEGSVFKVTMPLKKDLTEVIVEEKIQNVIMTEPLGLDILLVEDNKTNQLLARMRLERWDCSVDIANNGIEGVKMTQKKIYDVILMDIQMPIMDGYEATSIIKNDISEQVSLIPIIAMTAYASNADIKKARNAGMDDYIYKPFKPERLYQLLKHYGDVVKSSKVEEKKIVEVKPGNDSNEEFINLEFLRKETLNENTILKLLIELFNSDIDEYVEVIEKELERKNWSVLLKATHKIKPSISMFGIKKLESIMYSLEANLKEEVGLENSAEQLVLCGATLKLAKKELLNELEILSE